MGPTTIEAIIGDGALYHPDRDCAPEASWPCETHGEWACERCCNDPRHDTPCEASCDACKADCEPQEYGVVFSTDSLDGSECCDRCMMPLDRAAFDSWTRDQAAEAHERHTDNEPYCDLCAEEKASAEAEAVADPEDAYTDACAICHSDDCHC